MASDDPPVSDYDDNSILAYSSDESGSVSDFYFLRAEAGFSPPPISPTPPLSRSSLQYSDASSNNNNRVSYGSFLSDGSSLFGSVGSFMGGGGGTNSSTTKISGSILEEHAQLGVHDVTPPPSRSSTTRTSRTTNSERRRLLRRKQKEQEHREQLVRQVRGKEQPEEWRDVGWLILFIAQLVAVLYCAVRFGSQPVFLSQSSSSISKEVNAVHQKFDDDVLLTTFLYDGNHLNTTYSSEYYENFHIDYQTVLEVLSITGVYACMLSTLTVGFMLIIAKSMIHTALIFTMVASLCWGLFGLAMDANGIIPVLGFCALGLTLCYTLWVWEDRIPFAATNLHTALCGIRGSSDIILMGMAMLLVAFGWCFLWSVAFIGLVDSMEKKCPTCSSNDGFNNVFLYIVFVVSFVWTNVVIKNIVQVTTAAAVGTWAFQPDDLHPCCTLAVSKPLVRSMTTSLGSICFGSLVMIPARIMLSIFCCGNGNSSSSYLKRYNQWAYAYIGLYGYALEDAGTKAGQLFETREWTTVVNDNLIYNVLLMASIVIGGSTGIFGVLVEEVDGYELSSFHKPILTSFFVGSIFGFVLSSILLLGLVNSAVNTILVCFAAGPFEFHKNHPRLCQEMRDVWSQQVWEPTV